MKCATTFRSCLKKLSITASALAVTTLMSVGASQAAQAVSSPAKATRSMSAKELEQVLKLAKPMEKISKRKPALLSARSLPLNTASKAQPVIVQGSAGSGQIDTESLDVPSDSTTGGRNYGSGNLGTVYHYSDSLVPTNLRKTYPVRATGFFLFKQGGNWYHCSGSMISRSLVLVAGHCVHSGNNDPSGWNTEGYFYPSASGLAGGTPVTPYGFATAATYWTWSSWYSTGSIDQGYDIGIVVLNNRNNSTDPTKEMGAATGWYGLCTSFCLQAYFSLTQLGYPGNYYGGNFMTKGEHLYVSDGRDYIYGSGMRGGSSGGPHIANLGELSDSAANQGDWPWRNVVFGATSWGYISEDPKIQGMSPLSGPNNSYNFRDLFNPACTTAQNIHGAGSCSPL